MTEPTVATIDANEAVASVACRLSEVIAIYPITPASPMGEHAEEWSVSGRPNLWGSIPDVVEMQSEGGAAGALHGYFTNTSMVAMLGLRARANFRLRPTALVASFLSVAEKLVSQMLPTSPPVRSDSAL